MQTRGYSYRKDKPVRKMRRLRLVGSVVVPNMSGILLRRLDAGGEEPDELGAIGAERVKGRG